MAELEYPLLLVVTDNKNASVIEKEIDNFKYKKFNHNIGRDMSSPEEDDQKTMTISYLIDHEHPKDFGDNLTVKLAKSDIAIETKVVNRKRYLKIW
jgi:hypothetical protein